MSVGASQILLVAGVQSAYSKTKTKMFRPDQNNRGQFRSFSSKGQKTKCLRSKKDHKGSAGVAPCTIDWKVQDSFSFKVVKVVAKCLGLSSMPQKPPGPKALGDSPPPNGDRAIARRYNIFFSSWRSSPFFILEKFDIISYMIDKRLIEKNKRRLEAEQAHLRKLLAGIGPEHEELGSKDDDNALEVELYERNLAEERDVREKLQKVESALGRIAAGTYGVCQGGGEDIPAERLAAVPEAENCVAHGK